MDLTILSKKEAFLDLVMERLGKAPIDFCERAATIEKDKEVWRAAGVLLPLAFLTVLSSGTSAGEFFMVLIKRSSSVPQAGDLSCPVECWTAIWTPFQTHNRPRHHSGIKGKGSHLCKAAGS